MSDESRAHLSLLFDGLEGFVAMGIGFGGHRNGDGTYEFRSFAENFFRWPEQADTIVEKADEYAPSADVYVCPLLRRERSRKAGTGGVGRFAWADLDSDAPAGWDRVLLGPSSFVVSSGRGLHTYVFLSETLPAADLERVNQRLADALGADAGWSETKYLRLAGTVNHKEDPALPVRFVELARCDHDWALDELDEILPEHQPSVAQDTGTEAKEPTLVPAHLLARLDEEVEDRSKASYSFVAGCVGAGLDEAETTWLALRHQPTASKYGGRAAQEIGRTIGKVRETSRAGLSSSNSYAGTPGGVETLSSSNSSNSYGEAGWPDPPAEPAFYGLAGSYVCEISPYTEADPVAVLLQVLTTLGSAIGRRPHVRVEADRHHTNLFCGLIGDTAKARKGTSLGHARRLATSVDTDWASRIVSGLSSGEGLIYAVRDARWGIGKDGEPELIDEGEKDKRLQVIETEFASVLRVLQREGNTLSPIVRQSWDSGDLRTMTRRDPLTATGAHVSVIGHITLEELRRYLDATEVASGFANRYLWACVRRSKSLPEGSAIPDAILNPFVTRAARALDFARRVDGVMRDAPARALWAEHYERLATGRRGMVGALLARAEAQVLRLSLVYALLDESNEIRVEHLRAALALWDFCERSIVHVFGSSTGNPDADQILRALRSTTRGLTRTDISSLFGRNLSAGRIGRALAVLVEGKLATFVHEQDSGRTAERWFAVTTK